MRRWIIHPQSNGVACEHTTDHTRLRPRLFRISDRTSKHAFETKLLQEETTFSSHNLGLKGLCPPASPACGKTCCRSGLMFFFSGRLLVLEVNPGFVKIVHILHIFINGSLGLCCRAVLGSVREGSSRPSKSQGCSMINADAAANV